MINRKVRGFTLIELLVVIAIIGILAALVLVALGNARYKARGAQIKSGVGQLRTLAEIYYFSNSSSYNGMKACFDTPSAATCKGGIEDSVTALKSSLIEANGGGDYLEAEASATQFCVSAPLPPNTTDNICVDATGVTKDIGINQCLSGTLACP